MRPHRSCASSCAASKFITLNTTFLSKQGTVESQKSVIRRGGRSANCTFFARRHHVHRHMNYFVFEFRILDLSSCASSSHIHLYGLRWKAHSSNADEPAKYRMRPVIESGPGSTRGSSGRSFDFREYHLKRSACVQVKEAQKFHSTCFFLLPWRRWG